MESQEKSLPKDIRHITYIAKDKWVLPIWGAINRAREEQRIPYPSKPQEQEARNLGLSVSLKMEFVWHLMKLLGVELGNLSEFLNRTELLKPPYGNDVPTDIRDNILVFIDALIFELRTVITLTEQVAKYCLRLTSLPSKAGTEWLKGRFDGKWRTLITDARNLYTHESSPYIVVDFDRAPKYYDLLIPKKHPDEFKNTSDYYRLTCIRSAANEMFRATDTLREEILQVINNYNMSDVKN
ncbi:hypothetical protein MYX64_09255 [Nitrospinae bacterium AH_259_B05_G02_I21]|nr:hypothetical protein [Nitrospinae bacterium AH_259_B05_G02_I21]MDA2932547.1 hypothetical protein [Nitrospinae bacterium AH-259-F20]